MFVNNASNWSSRENSLEFDACDVTLSVYPHRASTIHSE